MINNVLDFKVAGVTFENDEGKDIQKIIKSEVNELRQSGLIDEQYEGYTNAEIKEMDLNVQQYEYKDFDVKLEETTFKDKPCIKIYIKKCDGDYVHIGYMPQNLIKSYKELERISTSIDGKAELIGGNYKHSNIVETDYEEKEIIEIEELTYGLEVTLIFKRRKVLPILWEKSNY